MAFQKPLQSFAAPAAAAQASDQFKFMVLNSSGKWALATSLGEHTGGVLQNAPAATDDVSNVAILGLTKIKSTATIAIDDPIATAADGTAVVALATHFVKGRALAAAVTGDVFTMEITNEGILA